MLGAVSGLGQLVAVATGGGRRHRRAWAGPGKAHIEVRTVERPGSEPLARAVETALTALPDVHWARVDHVTGRVVVASTPGTLALGDLVSVVGRVEAAHGVAGEAFPPDRPDHPGDREPLFRDAAAVVADVAGLGAAVAGRLAHLARLPTEAASVVPFLQNVPTVRSTVEGVLGPATTDLTLALAGAVTAALAQGPFGLVVDAGQRAAGLAERVALRRAWESLEPELWPGPTPSGPAPLELPPRPSQPTPGPAAVYADRAGVAATLAGAATLLTSRDPHRAAAAGVATLPKAARAGTEAFGAVLGRALSERGVLSLDASALRRLDRLDTVLVDDALLRTGALTIDRVVAVGPDPAPAERARLDASARRLFAADDVDGVRRRGPWALGPLDQLASDDEDVRRRQRELAGSPLLGLARDGRVLAVVTLVAELAPGARELVDMAHEAEHMVAVAGDDLALVHRLGADLLVDGGEGLVGSVRMLQHDGCSVALVAGADDAALAAADVGIGVRDTGRPAPWGADLLCGPGLDDARFVLHAAAVAYEISRQSAALALGGSGLAALLAVTGPSTTAAARAANAVNVAAALALANGVRGAVQLARRPVVTTAVRPPWHELEADEVLERLGTSVDGLDADEAARRRVVAGRAGEDQMTLGRAVLEEAANPLTPVLGVGAALSATVGGAADAALVAAVVAFNAVVGGAQRFRVARAVGALEAATTGHRARLRRHGLVVEVDADRVVPGDVVLLESGEAVPADCRIVRAVNLEVDESSLTGESLPVRKSAAAAWSPVVADRTSMLYEGTSVAAGTAEAVVVAVGADTEAGAVGTTSPPPPHGVERRLSQLGGRLAPAAVGGGGIVVLSGLLRGQPLAHALAPAVNLAVAAVPEGLPLLASAAQLSSARRLSQRGALVRNPRAIEALGRVGVLCVDKTGTLTAGRIRLQCVSDGVREVAVDDLDPGAAAVVAAGVRASPEENGDGVLPHLTDRAVVAGAARAGVPPHHGVGAWDRRAELPFEPGRGYHAVLGGHGEGFLLSVKGAPEVVLPRCDDWASPHGRRPLDEAARARLAAEVDRLARQGNRVLAVAERPASSRADLEDDRVGRLTLLGFLGLSDPVRPEAAASVARLQAAGVAVRMVTGDHPSTAEGIAKELGILDGARVLTGAELDRMDDAGLLAVLDDVSVFARVTPAHKVRIVAAYQGAGRAVSMTGDGANDAPAIRLADVGVALGEQATQAARGAADLVVPDGRVETLIDAIVEGRAMWGSVRDALGILLGGNLGEVLFTVAGSLVSGRSPVSARQLLLVNLMTDVAPGLAVAVRPPADVTPEQLLAEGPEASLGRSLEEAIVARAIATAAGATAAWLVASATGRRSRAGTVSLAALVGAQLGQTLATAHRDPTVLAASLGSAAALAAIVQTPGVSQFFGCTPIGPVGWAIAGTAAAGATAASAAIPPVLRRLRRAPDTGAGGPPGTVPSDGRWLPLTLAPTPAV